MGLSAMFLPYLLLVFQAVLVLSADNTSIPTNGTNTTLPTGPVTTDDICGGENGTVCVLDGIAPCCSFCGGDKRYCGDGCQPAFGLCKVPNSTLGNPKCSWAAQGDSPRCDGQCGADFKGALCDATAGPNDFATLGLFNYGPCCSKDGFCGNTTAHCEIKQGCQSGCWDGDNASSTPSSSVAEHTVTVTASASTATSSGLGSHVVHYAPEGCFAVAVGFLGALVGI